MRDTHALTALMNLVSNVVSLPLDGGAWHAHGCARTLIMARHNALARDLCAFAKEAGLRAACEQIAVELRPPEEETQEEETEAVETESEHPAESLAQS